MRGRNRELEVVRGMILVVEARQCEGYSSWKANLESVRAVCSGNQETWPSAAGFRVASGDADQPPDPGMASGYLPSAAAHRRAAPARASLLVM